MSPRGRPAFRTPSPETSSDEEEDPSAPNQPKVKRRYEVPDDVDIARDLDLSLREDKAVFKLTPFNAAKLHGTYKRSKEEDGKVKTGNIKPSDLDPDKPAAVGEKRKGKGRAGGTGVVMEGGWEVKKSVPKTKNVGGKGKGKGTGKEWVEESVDEAIEDTTLASKDKGKGKAVDKPAQKKWPSKQTGWVNGRGEPIPNSKSSKGWKPPSNPITTKQPTGPTFVKQSLASLNSLIDDIVQKPSPAKPADTAPTVKPNNKKSRTGKSKEDDKVVFRKIPANAAPNAKFPIVEGLEKQNQLPQKAAKPKKPISKRLALSDDSSSDNGLPLPKLDLNTLVEGLHRPVLPMPNKRKNERNQVRDSSVGVLSDELGSSGDEGEIQPVFHLGRKQENSRYFPQAIEAFPYNTLDKLPPITQDTVYPPSMRHSGPTNETDEIITPYPVPMEDDSRMYDPPSDPSTMTHIASHPSTIEKAHFSSSSSSALPYSSPLQRKIGIARDAKDDRYALLVRPEVRRADRVEELGNPVGKLEKIASAGVELGQYGGDDRDVRQAEGVRLDAYKYDPSATRAQKRSLTPPSQPNAQRSRWTLPEPLSSEEWSSEPKTQRHSYGYGRQQNLLKHYPNPPKHSDKFRIPGPIHTIRPNNRQIESDSPKSPIPTFSKVTKKLFTPSVPLPLPTGPRRPEGVQAPKQVYKLHTIKGTQYNAQPQVLKQIPQDEAVASFEYARQDRYAHEGQYGQESQPRYEDGFEYVGVDAQQFDEQPRLHPQYEGQRQSITYPQPQAYSELQYPAHQAEDRDYDRMQHEEHRGSRPAYQIYKMQHYRGERGDGGDPQCEELPTQHPAYQNYHMQHYREGGNYGEQQQEEIQILRPEYQDYQTQHYQQEGVGGDQQYEARPVYQDYQMQHYQGDGDGGEDWKQAWKLENRSEDRKMSKLERFRMERPLEHDGREGAGRAFAR